MKKIFEWHIFSLFPKHCPYCDRLIPADLVQCKECEKSLPRIEPPVCTDCGRGKKECTCKGSNYYDGITAPFYYEGNVKKGLHRFKFRKGVSNAKAYALEMVKTINKTFSDVNFDLICQVPASKQSIKTRGYNQSDILAKEISKMTDIEYVNDLLEKVYSNNQQHFLSAVEKRGNVFAVYESNKSELIKNKTLLLVDDISTSGETINECAKMLWLHDAKKIYCVTVALTKKQKKKSKQRR